MMNSVSPRCICHGRPVMEHTGPREGKKERGGGGEAYFGRLDLLFQPLPPPLPPTHLLFLFYPPFSTFCLLSCFSSSSFHENQQTETNPQWLVAVFHLVKSQTPVSQSLTVLALTPEAPPTSASSFSPLTEPDDIIVIITAILGSWSLLITAHVVLTAVNHHPAPSSRKRCLIHPPGCG